MLWLILHHLLRNPVGPAAGTCDPQTPAGHGPVRPHTVTSVRGQAMDVVVINDESTKADIEEAMSHITATLHRMPAHWTDRRATLHAKLDALLEDWERAAE